MKCRVEQMVTETRLPRPLEDHGRTLGTWVAGGVILVALAVRLWGISGESAWSDEGLTLSFLDRPTFAGFYHDSMAGTLPGYWREAMPERVSPVYFLVEYYWARLFGARVLSLRLLSVFLGVATVGVVYCLGRRLQGGRAAGYGALLMALSLSHTYYSQEIRFYALITLLVTLSMLAYLSLIEGRMWGWAVHVAANAVLLFTHPVCILLFAAQGFHLLLCHGRRPRLCLTWFTAQAAVTALFAGWVVWLGYDVGHAGQAYRPELLDWRDLPNAMLILAGGRFGKLDPAPFMWLGFSADRIIALLVAGLSMVPAWRFFRRGQAAGDRSNAVLLYTWCILPPLLLFLIALLWRHVFFARYVLYCGAGLCLLAGWGLGWIPHTAARRFLAAALCLMLLWQHAALPRPHRPGYAAFAAYMKEHAAPNAVVLPLKHFNTIPLRYYLAIPDERLPHHQGYGEFLKSAKTCVREGTEVWAVFWLWQGVDDFVETMKDLGTTPRTLSFGGLPPLHVVHIPGRVGVRDPAVPPPPGRTTGPDLSAASCCGGQRDAQFAHASSNV